MLSKEKYGKHFHNFNRIFDMTLARFANPWANPFAGFNIYLFEEEIGVPDNTSCKDFLLGKYGQDACDMVFDLLN